MTGPNINVLLSEERPLMDTFVCQDFDKYVKAIILPRFLIVSLKGEGVIVFSFM